MSEVKKILLVILTVFFLTGCNFIRNTFSYKDAAKEFVEALIKEDYNKSIELMAMEHEMARSINVDTLKMALVSVRNLIVENWGTKLTYSLMKTEKKFSTIEANNTPPNTTVVLLEFKNKKEFGVFQFLFDDNSKKILSINTLDIKAPIPTMTYFWLFGLFAICIPVFNVYVIIQIKRSRLKKKWLKYIAVILLNVPAITYVAVNGLSFKLLHFQLLGIGVGYMGYLNSYWAFGIPLGGLYWFWRIRRKRNKTTEETSVEQNSSYSETIDDENKTHNISL